VNENLQRFWHWYWHERKKPGLPFLRGHWRVPGRLCFLAIYGGAFYYFIYRHLSERERIFLRIAITNPFVILAFLGIYVGMLELGYIFCRLEAAQDATLSRSPWQTGKNLERYRRLFGKRDFFYRLYSWTGWISFLLGLVGAVTTVMQYAE